MQQGGRTVCRLQVSNARGPALMRSFRSYLQLQPRVRPARAIAKIFVRKLPALELVCDAVLEPAALFGWGYVQEALCNSDAVGNHHPFEFIDLVVTPLPFSLAGKTLQPFDQDAPLPGAVEHNDLPGVRQLFPKALQVASAALVR
jgi:hypothetical protein